MSTNPLAKVTPIKQDRFDIYKRVTIVSKVLNRFCEEEMEEVLGATPSANSVEGIGRFDMVLVHKDLRVGQLGLKGKFN